MNGQSNDTRKVVRAWMDKQAFEDEHHATYNTPLWCCPTGAAGEVEVEVRLATPSIVEEVEEGRWCSHLNVEYVKQTVQALVRGGEKIHAIKLVRVNFWQEPLAPSDSRMLLGLLAAKTLVEWWAQDVTPCCI